MLPLNGQCLFLRGLGHNSAVDHGQPSWAMTNPESQVPPLVNIAWPSCNVAEADLAQQNNDLFPTFMVVKRKGLPA